MPYDPVRDSDVSKSPAAASSSFHEQVQAHAGISWNSSDIREYPYGRGFDGASPAITARSDDDPSPSDHATIGSTEYPNRPFAFESSLPYNPSPKTPGQLLPPKPPSSGNSHERTVPPGFFDMAMGISPGPRAGNGMRGGLGDLLNGTTEEVDRRASSRPLSSSGIFGTRASLTPGAENMSRSSSSSGAGQQAGLGTGPYPKFPGQEKRGNSLSMLLNDTPSTPVTSFATPHRGPSPGSHSQKEQLTRSPISRRSTLSKSPSPRSISTCDRLEQNPRNTIAGYEPAINLAPSPPVGGISANTERHPADVGWINSFSQAPETPAERPYNPAQRLISPNRTSASPRGSIASDVDPGHIDGAGGRRRSTITGWSGDIGQDGGTRTSQDEGRGSVGGSSGHSRASVGSVQGYNPQLAPGSPFGIGAAFDVRQGDGSGATSRQGASFAPHIREPVDIPRGPAQLGNAVAGLPAAVNLASPRLGNGPELNGFTSVEPPQKQRKKSKREAAKEAKEMATSDPDPSVSSASAAVANMDTDGECRHQANAATNGSASADMAATDPSKPKVQRKRKASVALMGDEGQRARPTAKGRPRKDSSAMGSDHAADLSERGPSVSDAMIADGRPKGIPYNPISRIAPPRNLLIPLTASEAAFLQDPRNSRNPLRLAALNAPSHERLRSGLAEERTLSGMEVGSSGGSDGVLAEAAHVGQMAGGRHGGDGQKRSRTGHAPQPHHDPASHYNARPNIGREQRAESKIVGLKKFNKWVKSVTIKKFTCRRPDRAVEHDSTARGPPRIRPNGRVLDIGCGKGGDMAKWDKADIEELVGIDVAEKSIQDYKDRLADLRNPLRYKTSLHVLDCFSNPLSDVLNPVEVDPLFDNVSSQFCIHYAFKSMGNVRIMLENVSRHLRTGGVFFGTTVSSQKILHSLSQRPEGELSIGNEYYKITFEERENKGPFGQAYTFYLEDAIDDCVEYLVDWDQFVELATEYKLQCVYREDFDVFFEQEKEVPEYAAMAQKMGVMKGETMFMDAEQWEAATIYLAFAFEKVE